MKAQLITRREHLAELIPEWDALAQTEPRDGFFRTPGWCLAWMDHIRPDAEPFVVAVRDGEGRLAGLAPLCRMRYSDLGFRMRTVAWAGRDVVSGDFLDLLAAPRDKAEVTAAVLECLWEARSEWGLLLFSELLEECDSEAALQGFAERAGLPLRRQEPRICPYIALPGAFDQYLNALSSSTRYHIRRRIRDFEKTGARVDVYSDAEIGAHLDTLIRLHRLRWQKDDLPGTLGRPGFAAFLLRIFENPPAGSRCRLYLLTHEGAPVASLLAFWYGQSALYYQAGWDPASPLAAQSPGVVVMAQSIRDAIDQGLSYYEFLRGDESYKSRWTKTERKTGTVLVARSFMAQNYLRFAALKDVVKHRFLNGSRNQAGAVTAPGENDRRSTAAPAPEFDRKDRAMPEGTV